ncbi:MAG: transglycosylase SLT domain-containing protein [Pseudomonadota bacterium]
MVKRRSGAVCCAALLCLHASAAPDSQRVSVPLNVPVPYLEAQAASLLDFDEEGRGELRGDTCNYLELSDLSLTPRGAEEESVLRVDVAVIAHGGARLFGACRGPAALAGRVVLDLVPRAAPEGDAVVFAARGVEFRAENGEKNLLTAPSRKLADALLVPRLQNLRVDVGESLQGIDALMEQFLARESEAGPSLAEGTQLAAVGIEDEFLRVQLALELAAREAVVRGKGEDGETAAPMPALDRQDADAWRRLEDALDGFATVVVTFLAQRVEDRDVQLELLALLLDLRFEIAAMLAADYSVGSVGLADVADTLSGDPTDGEAMGAAGADHDDDPLRRLFLDTWTRLAAILVRAPIPTGDNADDLLRSASFLAAGDALRLVDELGPAFGIEISRDGLLRLAGMLMAGDVPPRLTPLPLAEDRVLQGLFGFSAANRTTLPVAPLTEPPLAWLRRLSPIAVARASEPDPAMLLRELFPSSDNLDLYLGVVARLIDETLASYWDNSRLNVEQQALFEPLVRATAWKETCWRHYLPAQDNALDSSQPRVIRSGVGAVGMMQIVGRVWRSLFDLDRLESDVSYNLAAGIDILEHYFVDYALRRGEDEYPGGSDNLVRATYAAYNGGPSKLGRYRREDVSSRARAVDELFYRQYLTMRDTTWPRESRCYLR